jgi:RNA polymerase sigma-70 factor (ECF subfamily)
LLTTVDKKAEVVTTDCAPDDDAPDDATPHSLIDGMRNEDPHAWCRLTQLWTPLIYTRCRRQGLSPDDAEDVTQNVLIRVFAGFSRFQRDGLKNRFRFWIASITRNVLADFFKSRKYRPVAAGGSDARQVMESQPDLVAEDDSVWCGPLQVVAQALRTVERDVAANSWQAFQLVQYQNLSPRQAAEQLGMSEGAVRVANHRIRERLRTELHGMLE